MREELEIITPMHLQAKDRDYIKRMIDDKVECMEIAQEYGYDYWDGDRRYGYGGFKFIPGKQTQRASDLIEHFKLKDKDKILDVGCGKGILMYELKLQLPNSEIIGTDISSYAKENAVPEINDNILIHNAAEKLPFKDNEFDLAYSILTLHNLEGKGLETALGEIERVGKKGFVCVESYRNDQEMFNVQCWALTCKTFASPDGWKWIFDKSGFTGDYEFIYFE